jgi:hypothetical protein
MQHYGDETGYRAYHTARGRDVENDEGTAILSSLIVASDWIDGTYRSMWPGTKVGGREQIRDWPRYGVVDINGQPVPSDVPPVEVDNATYEAAYREIANPGSLSMDYTPSKYKRVSIDGALSVDFAGFNSAADMQTQYTVIDQILYPILGTSATSNSKLSGEVRRA